MIWFTRNRVRWHNIFINRLEITEKQIIIDYLIKDIPQPTLAFDLDKAKMTFDSRGKDGVNIFFTISDKTHSIRQIVNGGWKYELVAELLRKFKEVKNMGLLYDDKYWIDRLER